MKTNPAWRFDSPGIADRTLINAFSELIGKIAVQAENQQRVVEHFKRHFAGVSGDPSHWSSSLSWAYSDLDAQMERAAKNAPMFIAAFCDACAALAHGEPPLAVPPPERVNRVLVECQAGYLIQNDELVAVNASVAIAVPERTPSLGEQVQALIQQSWSESDRLLFEGRNRQAVQEVLWLLESVVTAFQGLQTDTGEISGKYFNKIVKDLGNRNRGKSLEQVIDWITKLHGFLSSPTGGGIRHGADLRVGIATEASEARLYCNLIRSYTSYLISEHERLSAAGTSF